MLFLQYIMINLVLTKSSGPKSHAVLLTTPIFAGSVCVAQILVGRGSSNSNFPPTSDRTRPHPNFSWNSPSLTAVGRFTHKFVGNSAHMP